MTTTATLARLLNALRAALVPLIASALQLAPRPGWASVRIALSPLAVTVVWHDAKDAEVVHFEAAGTPELAEAVEAVLSSCLAALPAARARKVRAFAARCPEAVTLLTDASVAQVHVLLDPGGEADLIELGTLTDEVIH
jgi:hypothetical protein